MIIVRSGDDSTQECIVDQDPMLRTTFQSAAATLDTQNRAWVVVVGRLVDRTPRSPLTDDQMRSLIDAAIAAGDYPACPLAYAPEHKEYKINPDFHMLTVRSHLRGEPYLESRIACGTGGLFTNGFTRSGRLDDHCEVHPSQVLLIDFESVLAETVLLLTHTAYMFDYAGPVRLIAGIVADVPGHSLTLRALDEQTGELMPAGSSIEEFPPITLELTIKGSGSDTHRRCYEALTQVAARFGVSRPQFFTDPAMGTGDYQFSLP